jgi:hypothetical protein
MMLDENDRKRGMMKDEMKCSSREIGEGQEDC